jgi:hypothetical protein
VRSPILPVRLSEQVLEPLTIRFQADHLTRDPLQALEAEGFVIEQLERTKWGLVERIAAHKPRSKLDVHRHISCRDQPAKSRPTPKGDVQCV